MEDRLRLGMFMMPLHPAGRPMHAYLAENTEKALLLEKLGFDEMFIGEHFSVSTEPFPSPLMFAASLLPQTQRLVFALASSTRRCAIPRSSLRKRRSSIT